MVRRFSLWCTALILFTALASLGIAGCGGGTGGAGSSGLTSRDVFGRMTIHVTRDGGATRVLVVGEQVYQATIVNPLAPTPVPSPSLTPTAGSTQRMVVELYRLPVQSPPTPSLARSFDMVEGQTQAVINEIPAPAHYLVRGYLYEGGNAEYSSAFTVDDVEVMPGLVATATSSLTPRPSGSPTPSPGVSPYALLQVDAAAVPGLNPHLAMLGDGRFVVSWINSGPKLVYAQGFSAAPLWPAMPVSGAGTGTSEQDPFPAVNNSGLVGVAWTQTDSSGANVRARFLNLATGGGLSTAVNVTSPSTQTLQWTGIGVPGTGGQAVVDWLNTSSYPNFVGSSRVSVPTGTTVTPLASIGGSLGVSFPVMDMAGNGDFVQVYWEGGSTTSTLQARLNNNDATSSAPFLVVSGVAMSYCRPSVAVRNGIIAVAWGAMEGTNPPAIYVRRFTYTPGDVAAGVTPLDTAPIQVSPSAPSGSRLDPDVALNDAGNFVVVWRDYTYSESNPSIWGRTYTSAGAAGGPFQVNPSVANCAWPSVGLDSTGRFAVCWGLSSGGDIYIRLYPAGFTGP